ncbi:hypothetical protein I6E74_03460 [Salinibacterium sp. SWN139]|uniref:hypothetical protein n=1 Tax=Salinibacterium sp. SWN139 TaxID=2792055 RepID=UPI0018CF28B9|nr:hypothetical protein [Salinibacterium sp. SWN139]MBH0053224.1 hypothetical protein [Salinibacterium sp. SWN139]
MDQNPGPGNYAHTQGRVFEGEAAIAAAAARGEGNILPRPERPYNYRRGVLLTLLTIPITAVLVAALGLNSPMAGVAGAALAVTIAFSLFASGSARTPVTGRGFAVATGIGLVTMIAGTAISFPYSRYLTYLYDDGAGSIVSSEFATNFDTWVGANTVNILLPGVLVTVVSVVVVWRRARAARAANVA